MSILGEATRIRVHPTPFFGLYLSRIANINKIIIARKSPSGGAEDPKGKPFGFDWLKLCFHGKVRHWIPNTGPQNP